MTYKNQNQPNPNSAKKLSAVAIDNRALSSLLDALRDAVLFFDRFGVIQHANACARCWWPDENLQGRTFVEVAQDWDDPAERQREIMQVGRTGLSIMESREHSKHKGQDTWYRVDKIPTSDGSGSLIGVMLVIADITLSVQRELIIRDSEARYRAFIASSSDSVWRYDIRPPIDSRLPQNQQVELVIQRAVLAECNESFAQLHGAGSAAELIGLPLTHQVTPNLHEDIREFVFNGYRLKEREYQLSGKAGQAMFLQSNAIGIVENGLLTRVWGTTRNVTEKRQYLARLEYLANHDVLTSLPNRGVLYRAMGATIKARKAEQKAALLLIDLDRFKEINDTLGHLAGDKVLKQLAARLRDHLRDTSGIVARLGGDEFAVFLPNIRNPQQAVVLAHQLLDAIAMVFELEGLHTELGASIGVSICPDQAADASTLMRFADVAMYRAKTSLQGVAVYDAAFDPHSPKRLELMGALGRAIREDQLTLHYQPKINLLTNSVCGFEALLRWNHPQRGSISPKDFIPIAEHSNLIHPMTLWVLEQSIRQCRLWADKGFAVTLAMNLSARNLLDERVVIELPRLLKKYGVSGSQLELEITESMIMADPARAEATLLRIHRLGVQLAVDDFGTGYSSLAYLKRLPVQTLKIDSSFVRSMLNDEQDEIIVNSTVNLAHNLGLKVVAEGVESEWVYQKLVKLGCDCAQGYYMGRPMAVEQAEVWLAESQWGLARSLQLAQGEERR